MQTILSMLPSQAILPILIGATIFFVFVGIWLGLLEDKSADRRLRELDKRRRDLREEILGGNSKSRGADIKDLAKNVAVSLKLGQGKEAKSVAVDLAQAGFRSRDAAAIYLFIRLLMPIAGAGLTLFFIYGLHLWKSTTDNIILAVIASGILASLIPAVVLRNLQQRRITALLRSLPDGLDLFVICAEAGLSLDATFDRVSKEISDAHPVLADEFGLTSVELGFMPERSKALQGLANRCPLQGIRSLISTLIQTERYGTPLAKAMRVLSEEMRNERMLKAEEKAARLPAIMTVPMILFILPPLFIILMGPAILSALEAFKN
jgi:tight adherence protein C